MNDPFLREWGAAWSAANVGGLLPFYTPDAHYVDVGSARSYRGHEGIAAFFDHMRVFASDFRLQFEVATGRGHRFAAHWTWSGTADGPLRVADRTYAASGVSFAIPGIAWCVTDQDGRIVSHEDYYDLHYLVRRVQGAGG